MRAIWNKRKRLHFIFCSIHLALVGVITNLFNPSSLLTASNCTRLKSELWSSSQLSWSYFFSESFSNVSREICLQGFANQDNFFRFPNLKQFVEQHEIICQTPLVLIDCLYSFNTRSFSYFLCSFPVFYTKDCLYGCLIFDSLYS